MTGVLIPCARPHSFTQSISVIDRRRAPTGTNRPSRSRFGAVLDARVILNASGLHFPILLSSPSNSPHQTPGTAFPGRNPVGFHNSGKKCNPQLPMSILKKRINGMLVKNCACPDQQSYRNSAWSLKNAGGPLKMQAVP